LTQITNLHDLPAPFVEAIINDDYDRGAADISATGLLSPPRIAALAEKYADQLVEDASDRVWLLLGKAVHAMIEKSSSYGISELRLFTESLGWKVSGQFDHLSIREESGKAKLTDWKVTSVWTLVYGERRFTEWEEQLNIYALLLHEAGIEVDELEVIAILRDWQKSQVSDEGNYPSYAVQAIPLTLWSPEETRRFIDKRVAMHQAARTKLPLCSDEDRWAKPSKYAVYGLTKTGTQRARADRLFDLKEDAEEHAARIDGVIDFRRGDQWTRCKSYCGVAQFCTQFTDGDTK